jgi:benzodiazapine receptor
MKTKLVVPEFVKIIGYILICLMAGIIGALFTATGEGSWYSAINKPSFNPPNYLFGPVWTCLYVMMGISLYLVLKNKADKRAKIFFGAQLVLNTLWTLIFFGLEMPILAFVEIVVLWIAILFTIISFYKFSKVAAYLLIPYILWVSFASLLTLSIAIIN